MPRTKWVSLTAWEIEALVKLCYEAKGKGVLEERCLAELHRKLQGCYEIKVEVNRTSI